MSERITLSQLLQRVSTAVPGIRGYSLGQCIRYSMMWRAPKGYKKGNMPIGVYRRVLRELYEDLVAVIAEEENNA